MDRHATVKLCEYTVPLIGIAPDATQQECAKCKQSFHLSEITLDEAGQPCCKRCLSPNDKLTDAGTQVSD